MNSNTRIDDLTARLIAKGVVDVKILFSPNVAAYPAASVRKDVADLLEKYLDGSGVTSTVGDSVSA